MVTRYAYELNKFMEQLKVELKQSIITNRFSSYQCPVTSPLTFDPKIITFPAYLCPPMCEQGLTDTLPRSPWVSISSLNLLTSGGPQTPQRRSRDA